MVDLLSLNSPTPTDGATLFASISKLLEKLHDQIRVLSLHNKQQNSNIQKRKIDHLCQLVDSFCHIFLSLSEFCGRPHLSIEQQSSLFSLIQFIPTLVEDIWNFMNDEKLANLMRSMELTSIENVAVGRTKMFQAAMRLVCTYYKSAFVSNERRFRIVFDFLDKHEFIIRLDEELNLERELSKFLAKQIATEQQMQLAVKSLKDAYEQKARSIKETLNRQKILQFIGYPKEKHIADQIQDLSEIIPDLSKQQLHLCLRHFGYDFEKTLEGLCEREKLPLNLKILLRTKDTFEDVIHSGRKMQTISDEKLAGLSENGYFDKKEVGDRLGKIEQLLGQLATDEAIVELDGKILVRKVQTQEEQGVTAEERSALIAASIRRANEQEEEEEEMDDLASDEEEAEQRLDLKLATEVGQFGPKLNRLNQFADNIYDDEYDDTYEHAQLYTEVDLGAASIDEKEIGNNKCKWSNQEESDQNAGPSNKHVQSLREKNIKRDGNVPASRKGGMIAKNMAELKEGGSSKSAHQKKPPEKPAELKLTAVERRYKEQNKGKEKQKGADRKMRGAL